MKIIFLLIFLCMNVYSITYIPVYLTDKVLFNQKSPADICSTFEANISRLTKYSMFFYISRLSNKIYLIFIKSLRNDTFDIRYIPLHSLRSPPVDLMFDKYEFIDPQLSESLKNYKVESNTDLQNLKEKYTTILNDSNKYYTEFKGLILQSRPRSRGVKPEFLNDTVIPAEDIFYHTIAYLKNYGIFELIKNASHEEQDLEKKFGIEKELFNLVMVQQYEDIFVSGVFLDDTLISKLNGGTYICKYKPHNVTWDTKKQNVPELEYQSVFGGLWDLNFRFDKLYSTRLIMLLSPDSDKIKHATDLKKLSTTTLSKEEDLAEYQKTDEYKESQVVKTKVAIVINKINF